MRAVEGRLRRRSDAAWRIDKERVPSGQGALILVFVVEHHLPILFGAEDLHRAGVGARHQSTGCNGELGPDAWFHVHWAPLSRHDAAFYPC